jgi:hypothetical protein
MPKLKLSPEQVVNPSTGRLVSKNGRQYLRLVEAGVIKIDDEPLPPPNTPYPSPKIESETLKKDTKNTLQQIAKDNRSKMAGLSAKETNNLLRELLIAKLTKTAPSAVKENVKKKGKKYKVVSSSESSDSDETSDSDSE